MEHNLEDLKKMLEETKAPAKEKQKNIINPSVLKFINKLNIKPSIYNKIPTYHIYMEYRRSIDGPKCRPVSFFRSFKKLFQQKRYGSQRYYMITGNIDLSKESINKSEKVYRRNYVKK